MRVLVKYVSIAMKTQTNILLHLFCLLIFHKIQSQNIRFRINKMKICVHPDILKKTIRSIFENL